MLLKKPGKALAAAWMIVGLMFAFPVFGKTIRVERWGEDLPGCGSKSTPCQSITFAIASESARNDRIRVGPGEYAENLTINFNLSGPLDGLKLESTAGRWGTTIRGNINGLAVIRVGQSRVQIGRRGKGFTILGPTGPDISPAGVENFGDGVQRVRVEGNWFADHDSGIELGGVDSGRHRIAHNLFSDMYYGVYLDNGARTVVHDNRFEIDVEVDNDNTDPDHSIALNGDSSYISIFRNRILGASGSSGISARDLSYKIRILDNVVAGADSHGIWVDAMDGARIERNIAAENSSEGFMLEQTGDPLLAKVRYNLSFESGNNGYRLSSGSNVEIEANTSLQNTASGFHVVDSTITSIGRNSSYGNDIGSFGCGISKVGSLFRFEKHFFGDASGADAVDMDADGHDAACGGYVAPSTASQKPTPLSIRRAAKL